MGKDEVRVLGIDPGTRIAGWGVVQGPLERARSLGHGVWHLRGTLPVRLAELTRHLEQVLTAHAPHLVAVERNFAGQNVQSALRLGEARGAIFAAIGARRIDVVEYTPASVKLAITGSGRASKEQVQTMVTRLLALPNQPASDAADALAIALCHLQSAPFTRRVAQWETPLRWPRVRVRKGSQ